MSSCKILYINTGVGVGSGVGGTCLTGVTGWSGKGQQSAWRSPASDITVHVRALGQSSRRCCLETKPFLSSHFSHFIICCCSHFDSWNSSFSNTPLAGFPASSLQNKTEKNKQTKQKSTKCWTVEESCRNEGFSGLGVDFLVLENIYFCAVLIHVLVDCFFFVFYFLILFIFFTRCAVETK